MSTKIKIAVCGAAGRMGKRIIAFALDKGQPFELVGAVENAGCPLLGQDAGVVAGIAPNGVKISADFPAACAQADVVIDFTSPQATLEHVRALPFSVKGLVAGTTGLSPEQVSELRGLAEGKVSCVFSPNMSVGVNVLFSLVRKAAAVLKDRYDVEIVERHHNLKKDAPSGTAVRFGEIIAEAQQTDYGQRARHGRAGICPREKSDIGMHAVRAGDIVGDHEIIFAGCSEVIEFKHSARSRDTFAQGALVAARFLAERPRGWYSMEDVFDIR